MHDWLEQLRGLISGSAIARPRKWLHRRFRLSGEVVAWLDAPGRTVDDRCAFAELLLRLDADPITCSVAVLRPDAPRGMRWAPFGSHKAIFTLDSSGNSIRVVLCC